MLKNENTKAFKRKAITQVRKVKGTVQRDFLTPVFFTKRFILVSIDMPKSDIEKFFEFSGSYLHLNYQKSTPCCQLQREVKDKALGNPYFLLF